MKFFKCPDCDTVFELCLSLTISLFPDLLKLFLVHIRVSPHTFFITELSFEGKPKK